MKKVWKTLVGLIFDDWWLFLGVLVAILLTFAGIQAGFGREASGWVLLALVVIAMIISLTAEYRKKAGKR